MIFACSKHRLQANITNFHQSIWISQAIKDSIVLHGYVIQMVSFFQWYFTPESVHEHCTCTILLCFATVLQFYVFILCLPYDGFQFEIPAASMFDWHFVWLKFRNLMQSDCLQFGSCIWFYLKLKVKAVWPSTTMLLKSVEFCFCNKPIVGFKYEQIFIDMIDNSTLISC